jgi:hypothetical protein
VKATIASTCLEGVYSNNSSGAPNLAPGIADRCPSNPFDKSGPPPVASAGTQPGWTGYAPIGEISN